VDNQFKSLNPDLEQYLKSTFQGKHIKAKIFFIGDTGFIGKWFKYLARELNLLGISSIQIVGMSRSNLSENLNYDEMFKHLSIDQLNELNLREFTHIIWGASSTSRNRIFESSYNLFSDLLFQIKNQEFQGDFINLSSGAVYEKAFSEYGSIDEDSKQINIDQHDVSDYVKEKILFENGINKLVTGFALNCVNARLFSFCGPGMPTGEGYAMSEFFQAVLNDNDILIKGNPNSLRTYMHPIDLVVIIMHLIIRYPKISNVNIGAGDPFTIYEFANKISRLGKSKVLLDNNADTQPIRHYVPDLSQQKLIADIYPYFTTDKMLLNTFLYYRNQSS
jgi:nucleoside-diphosphate-sugar epimerase